MSLVYGSHGAKVCTQRANTTERDRSGGEGRQQHVGLTSTADVATYVTYDLAPLVAAVRAFQTPRGEIAGDTTAARSGDADAGIADAERHGGLGVDLDACLDALPELGGEITHIEQLPDDQAYVDAAGAFVQAWLPPPGPGPAGRARYGDPAGFARLVRPRLPHLGLIDFARVGVNTSMHTARRTTMTASASDPAACGQDLVAAFRHEGAVRLPGCSTARRSRPCRRHGRRSARPVGR